MLGYYRRHVENFSKHAAPLCELTRKDKSFKWTPQCEEAMRYLIRKVINAPVLRFPILDGSAPFILTTDASDVSLAATLAQVQDGMEHPIAFHSRSLNDAEKRRGSAENEVNAIVSGINVFRQYLLGNKFLVYTDNAACIQILKKPNLSPKLHRWALMIQDYDFDIFHKAGKANTVCDALSRIQVQAIHTVPPSDEIRVAQRRDAQLLPVIQYLLKGTYPHGIDVMEKEKLEKKQTTLRSLMGFCFVECVRRFLL
jgi:hypothetical protein